jgi:hypothetical protein
MKKTFREDVYNILYQHDKETGACDYCKNQTERILVALRERVDENVTEPYCRTKIKEMLK